MAVIDPSTYVEWMWRSNLNPFSKSEPEEWSSYSEQESELIEKAHASGVHDIHLKNYLIDFSLMMQVSLNDPSKQRPIRRDVHNKEAWIKCIRKLGEGSFGKVYEGIYRKSQTVAYKVTKSRLSAEAMTETNILKTLHHPSIVRYIDVIHTSRHTLLVMELIDGGTLFAYTRTTSQSLEYWCTTRNMLIDVAYALSYLSEKNIVHADLKSDNILLRSNGKAVLSDFGLSKIIDFSAIQETDSGHGAIRWLAPELCFDTPERSSFRSDVWAFGCVLIEVITQDVPWANEFARHRELMKALSDRQNAPYFEEVLRKLKAPDKLRALLCACCTWPKVNRPSFDKIIKDLNSMSDSDLQVGTEGKGPMKLTKHPTYGNRALYSSDEEENYVPNGKPPKKNQDLPSVITDKF